MNVGIMCGRYQPWTLTSQRRLEYILQNHDRAYVIIDHAHAPRSPQHPWTHLEIMHMIYASQAFAEQRVVVAFGSESPEPAPWAARIEAQVLQDPKVPCTLYANDDDLPVLQPLFKNYIVKAWPVTEDDNERFVRDLYFDQHLRCPDELDQWVPSGTLARMMDFHGSAMYHDVRLQRLTQP